jgi:hypothetical protein
VRMRKRAERDCYAGQRAFLLSIKVEYSHSTPLTVPTVFRDGSHPWAVPVTANSAVYFAHLVRQDTTSGENYIPFVVRDDETQHDIVFQTSDMTWHAYNGWGRYSPLRRGRRAASDGPGVHWLVQNLF